MTAQHKGYVTRLPRDRPGTASDLKRLTYEHMHLQAGYGV